MDFKAYKVNGGQKLRLSDVPTKAGNKSARAELEARTAELQQELGALQDKLYAEGKQSLLLVLQARDAGGKDGTVKHVLEGVNPQGVIVTSFKVPSELERKHDFLWRVHLHAPAAGMMAVFNRSHYEDVLVTRVHQLMSDKQAQERFEDIQAFEKLLSRSGTRILKVYLHISPQEQQQRLQDRVNIPEKRWKFNIGDLAERTKWREYTHAYEDALRETSTTQAPWYVIPADRKWYRDYLISELLVQTLRDMNPQYPAANFDPSSVVVEDLPEAP